MTIFLIQLHFSVQFLFFLAESLVILVNIFIYHLHLFFLLNTLLFFILSALSHINNSPAYLNLTVNIGFVACPFLFLYPFPKPFFLLFHALDTLPSSFLSQIMLHRELFSYSTFLSNTTDLFSSQVCTNRLKSQIFYSLTSKCFWIWIL